MSFGREYGEGRGASALTRRQHTTDTDRNRASLLEEYKALRTEVTTSLQLQQSILSFGTATLGILITGAFLEVSTSARGAVLLVFEPLVAYLVLVVWFSEVLRMRRAGAYIASLEKHADIDYEIGTLAWESERWAGRCRRSGLAEPDFVRNAAVTLLFLMLAAASIAIGWNLRSGIAPERVFAVASGGMALVLLALLWKGRQRQVDELRMRIVELEATRADSQDSAPGAKRDGRSPTPSGREYALVVRRTSV